MKIELTTKAIDALISTGKRYDVRFKEQAARGLLLRIGASGSKTWSFWQKVPNSKDIFSNTLDKVELDAHNNIKPTDIDRAIAWAAKQRAAVSKGKTKQRAKRKAKGPLTLEALYAEYVRDHSSNKLRPSSKIDQERIWKNHIQPEFGDMKIKNIDHTEVDIFISRKVSEFKALGGTGGRANNILAMMSSMMNFALKRRYIKSNPCFGIVKLKTDHSWPELSDSQRTALREVSYNESDMMGLIVDMALITGARKQEILQARWEEIIGNIWTLPKDRKKGKKEHVLILPPKLAESLNSWRKRIGVSDNKGTLVPLVRNTGFVFPSNGNKWRGKFNKKIQQQEGVIPELARPAISDIKGPWTRIRKAANLEHIRFHDLRHDFGTQSAKAGMNIYSLMNAMSHQRIETTMLYINKAGLSGQKEVLAERETRIGI